jgi:predicted enzyme related to lactoylglutathione lyase
MLHAVAHDDSDEYEDRGIYLLRKACKDGLGNELCKRSCVLFISWTSRVLGIALRFVHTNIVARDWERLAEFYVRVFSCIPVPPERRLSGRWLERATGIPGAKIRGTHLKLPGHGNEGPTLEIFQYYIGGKGSNRSVNSPGFAHIAFYVDDIEAVREAILEAGGSAVGELVRTVVPSVGEIEFAYMRDPEGNVIEIQHIR